MLAGAGDDARYFQISVQVQPGNSSGGLEFRLQAALRSGSPKGGTPNVVSAKLKEPETKERKFEEVVKSAEQAAVLVLVY